ncbi:enoyl-CoA hydratase-related protein [Novosphingobium sp. KCTC 2891]|uniref:enoyl-CoA hydratase/isomerase family protein n=1 Tax=Novosphingobium sp. KCTC 2891 TaxID=2989730 RepID=UPI002222049C|nr:enoyl-CoA hydratase-related protein [Novosphingobium sp. KCTC 2891]MCW1384743.1 enoyl-CoA hydratase-related protein [Novosphingobium sp. KCTC 2891]
MSAVLLEITDGIGRITLNRPEQGNAIDMALATDLEAAARACASEESVRAVVLAAAGRMFCVGGDIGAFADAGDRTGAFLSELAGKLHEAVLHLSAMDKPLIGLVQGPAAGAGLSLAMLGDIVLASEASHFTAAYTAIGLTPDGGMSWLLPRVAGMRVAQELILTNRRVLAAEAANVGIVTRVVAAEDLAAEGEKLAQTLAAAPVRALGSVRRLLRDGQLRDLAGQLDAETAAISAAGDGAEGREGIGAFLARRKPDFRAI